MPRKFRVTRWLCGKPFSAFCVQSAEALNLIEIAVGRELSMDECRPLLSMMIKMVDSDQASDATIFHDENGDALVSLSHIDPQAVYSIAS